MLTRWGSPELYHACHGGIIAGARPGYSGGRLDPYVSKVLAQEPPEVQRAVIGILSMLKIIAKGMVKEGSWKVSSIRLKTPARQSRALIWLMLRYL